MHGGDAIEDATLARDVRVASFARRIRILLHRRIGRVERRDRLVVLVRQHHRDERVEGFALGHASL
jgi:hypothetical protein